MRRIIVTGGGGFIGYHLAEYLSRQPDTQVTIIDNHSRGALDEMFAELAARFYFRRRRRLMPAPSTNFVLLANLFRAAKIFP